MDQCITAITAGCVGLALGQLGVCGAVQLARLPAAHATCQLRLPDASPAAVAEMRWALRSVGSRCEALSISFQLDGTTSIVPLPDTRWLGRPL